MIELPGKYNTARVFTDNVDSETMSQIIGLCTEEFSKESQIRIMPDTHAGAGCVIGTTMTIHGKVVPNLVGVDIGCFTEDIKVQLCDGRQLSFKELIEEDKLGIEHYGYSIDKNANVKVSKLECPRKTRNVNKLVKITLDNNEIITCTLDHIFYTRDNIEIKAENLEIGQSLMPLYINKAKDVIEKVNNPSKFELEDYNVVYNPNEQYYEFIHWLSDEYNERNNLTYETIEKSWVRHHKDFNKENNNPTNIQRVGFKEHWKIHSEAIGELSKQGLTGFKKARENNPELFSNIASNNMKKLNQNPEFIEKRNKASIQNWKNYNNSEKAKIEAKKAGQRGSVLFSNRNNTDEMKKCQKIGKIKKVIKQCYEQFNNINEANYENIRKEFYNYPKYNNALNIIKECGFNSFEDLLNEDIIREKINHKIINIEIIDVDNIDVYCLTVSEFGNFALASGVFVHNCGMETIKLNNKHIEFEKLDKVIRKYVPSGFNIRDKQHPFAKQFDIESLRCLKKLKDIKPQRAVLSIGTLGGGNHFIEVNQDKDGYLYLVIHSGSRNLGLQVANHYQRVAIDTLADVSAQKNELIAKLKSQGREKDIQDELKKLQTPVVNKQLAYVYGQNFDDYIHDMKIVQNFAVLNRKAMADVITREMKFKVDDQFSTIHNYIDTENMILRKGAISAQKGEKVLIPINMRDGSIIAIGKGNPDWNFSAPHGAGRLMSRSKAKDVIPMKEFKETMKDVWTTSVCTSTLDEAPQAYKPMEEILENIQDTVDVVDIIKPLYNYKAN